MSQVPSNVLITTAAEPFSGPESNPMAKAAAAKSAVRSSSLGTVSRRAARQGRMKGRTQLTYSMPMSKEVLCRIGGLISHI